MDVADAEIGSVDNIKYLLIKRYDRINTLEGKDIKIERLHQEDFCQALGISPTHKYQSEGGPSLKNCFELLRDKSSVPLRELEKLLEAVVFNCLIGNCDAHGKNFSLLYNDGIQLTPLYDLVCTLYYQDLDKKMAMKIGGEYEINKITPEHFDHLSSEISFSKSEVRIRILKLCEKVINVINETRYSHKEQINIANLIRKRCENFSEMLNSKMVKKK
jgi:serine/threonine-protein kinase HipA